MKNIDTNINKNIQSGFKELDQIIGGFKPGCLYLIGSRPGIGKTTLLLSTAKNIAENKGIPVGLFSHELSNTQIAMRLIGMESGLDMKLVTRGQLPKQQWDQLVSSTDTLSNSPIFIDDTVELSLKEIKQKAEEMIRDKNVKLLAFDYLQLLIDKGKNKLPENFIHGMLIESRKARELITICQFLKKLAEELNIPILVTSQLSRTVEDKESKKPNISDILYGENIVEYFESILLLHRPGYYGLKEPTHGNTEIIITKNNQGEFGKCFVNFNDKCFRFTNVMSDKNIGKKNLKY